jgi:predicted Rossmann fold flavoprotein
MKEQVDLAIVGAGAAGLATAIFSAEQPSESIRRIVLLEGEKSIGAKILVSGGGRCNVPHAEVTARDFFGNRRIIKNVLAAFPVQQTVEWLNSLGVEVKREPTGKLFPVTDKARTVLDALVNRCRKLGVDILVDHRVTAIEYRSQHDGFVVHHGRGSLAAKCVVLATGGRSLPKSGSDGFGYELARRCGHRIGETSPALVPLILNERAFHSQLAGISQKVELTTLIEGRMVDRRTGSLLWTHVGISGPAVMDTSRFWTTAKLKNETVDLFGNFFPAWDRNELVRWFDAEASHAPRKTVDNTLAQFLPDRFASLLCSYLGCDPRLAMGQCPRKTRLGLFDLLTRFRFPVERDRGWNHAEVTAGGVPLEEIDFRTMESKIVPGLYLVGEILDCDGRIGGFNFQWAWATGYLAGRAAAKPRTG